MRLKTVYRMQLMSRMTDFFGPDRTVRSDLFEVRVMECKLGQLSNNRTNALQCQFGQTKDFRQFWLPTIASHISHFSRTNITFLFYLSLRYLRGLILGSAVKHNDTAAVKSALQLFNDFKIKGTPIAANLKGSIYLAGVKYGTEDDWNFLWKRRENTRVPTEKRKIMHSLTNTEDPNILKK